jgi:hypothetical protein
MQIKESKQCSAVKPSNFSAVSAASDLDSSQSADSISGKQSKFLQAPGQYTPSTLEVHQSGMTRIPSTLTQESLTASLGEAPVKTSADAAENGELKESARDCGGKCSESSTSADPLSLAGKTLRERCLGDVEKWLPISEWSDIKSKAQSSYRHRNSERRTKENASSLLATPTTYPQSLKGQGVAGRNKLESSLRLPANIPTPRGNDAVQGHNSRESGGINEGAYLRLATPASRDFKGISPTQNRGGSAALPDKERPFILPAESANPQVWGWMMGFPKNWCESVLMPPGSWESIDLDGGVENPHHSKQVCGESESKVGAIASTTTELPAYPVKPSPSPSELSICGNSFKTSGLGISFGKTLQWLTHKTVTRRAWKDSHAQKFINAFHQNKLVKAWDKDIRYGGKQIGWCRLLCAPYKEQLATMPQEDLQAEGGMCSSVGEFVKRYFKGNSSLEVWVIRFQFIAREQPASTQAPQSLGVYSNSGTQTNSNSVLTSLAASIHQTQLPGLALCADSGSKIDKYSFIPSAIQSIHQALFYRLGVYSGTQHKTNGYFPFTLSIESIYQASSEPRPSFGVSSDSGSETNRYSLIPSANESIHQASLTTLGVYSDSGSKTNSYSCLSPVNESIHQVSLITFGVYSAVQHQTNSYFPLFLSIESIHQALPEPRQGFGVYSSDSNKKNSNDPVRNRTESIELPSNSALLEHQTIPDAYQNSGNKVDINIPIPCRNHSTYQRSIDSLGVYSDGNNSTDTNAPNNSLAESIHQAPAVQNGNGLVYSFWKGESIVNHYRYKVKVNGKWKVKSVYIPVGKLPKVREAIASRLGVAVIVTEILGKKL